MKRVPMTHAFTCYGCFKRSERPIAGPGWTARTHMYVADVDGEDRWFCSPGCAHMFRVHAVLFPFLHAIINAQKPQLR